MFEDQLARSLSARVKRPDLDDATVRVFTTEAS